MFHSSYLGIIDFCSEHVPYNTLALGKSNGSSSEQGFVKHVKYQCPITSAEFNGSKQFFGIWICGHTLSDPVFRELKNKKKETNVCPVCNASYSETDLIRINPIHPDHKDQSKKLFMKRRKAQDTRSKLKRKMRKVSFSNIVYRINYVIPRR